MSLTSKSYVFMSRRDGHLSPSERVLNDGPLLLHSFLVKEFRHNLAEFVFFAVGDAVAFFLFKSALPMDIAVCTWYCHQPFGKCTTKIQKIEPWFPLSLVSMS